MRCPSCSKMAANDTSTEPEIDLELEAELAQKEDSTEDNKDLVIAHISGTARIVITSECCGDELKEATFDIQDVDVEVARAEGCECDLEQVTVEVSTSEITDRYETEKAIIKKDGTVIRTPIKSRRQKHFYGVMAELTVSCPCSNSSETYLFEDECPAGGMDELV